MPDIGWIKYSTLDLSQKAEEWWIKYSRHGNYRKQKLKALWNRRKFHCIGQNEYELLKYLVDNEGIALSRDKILNNVWNYDYYGDSRTIDSHIKKVRHKLGKKGKYIETVRGIGYKFEVK